MGKKMKTSRQIIAETAEKNRITVADILGDCRQRWVAWPRQEAMFRMFVECPHLSLPQIAKALGGRDHSTAIHGIKRECERRGLDYDRLRAVVGRPDHRNGPRRIVEGRINRSAKAGADYFQYLAADYAFVMTGAMHHGH
jgi:hypothetical protein